MIKRFLRLTMVAGLVLSATAFATTTATPSHTHASREAQIKNWIQYVDSGSYNKELAIATEDAKKFLQEKIEEAKQNPNTKLAVVFDIDETVLSNFSDMKRLHFTQNKQALAIAYAQAKDTAISPSKELYNFAKENNVTIFFVTGRADSAEIRQASVDNLQHEGFDGWKEMIMRPLEDDNASVIGFKSATRKALTEQGYTIVLNVGDQYSDLAGGYALKSVKLPNPFYTLS